MACLYKRLSSTTIYPRLELACSRSPTKSAELNDKILFNGTHVQTYSVYILIFKCICAYIYTHAKWCACVYIYTNRYVCIRKISYFPCPFQEENKKQ